MIDRKQPEKIVKHVETNEPSADKLPNTITSYIIDIVDKYHKEYMEKLIKEEMI